jgi:hypothetical protein
VRVGRLPGAVVGGEAMLLAVDFAEVMVSRLGAASGASFGGMTASRNSTKSTFTANGRRRVDRSVTLLISAESAD